MSHPQPSQATRPSYGYIVSFHDLHPTPAAFREEVLAGLRQPYKAIPAKFFYDRRGSALFDEICQLEEYYLTRTEIALLEQHAAEIAALVGDEALLIEYGSGSGRKIRILLDHLPTLAAYVPVDISKEHLLAAATELAQAYPFLRVTPVCADYTQEMDFPDFEEFPYRRRVVFFPGSTIGNFTPAAAEAFLRHAAEVAGHNGALLIGVDLKKDPVVIDAAYNDSRGVTAEFNLNLLRRINIELNADFDLRLFQHRAFYDPMHGRVEMHLVSTQAQTVHIGDETFTFAEGETIHTEDSYKYDLEAFQAMAARAGWSVGAAWQDERRYFAVCFFTVA
ncbi:MAG: L-histidine N(alpha)-methyltransferase [Chloracidobacterium sp.]|nr:L-histidine N(alpha)-methyltransferase [Chloracidobacterium sp.]MDW8217872.1 L-histidine N(alpha)-methyltransferase [Acidobacteriota bacterium]